MFLSFESAGESMGGRSGIKFWYRYVLCGWITWVPSCFYESPYFSSYFIFLFLHEPQKEKWKSGQSSTFFCSVFCDLISFLCLHYERTKENEHRWLLIDGEQLRPTKPSLVKSKASEWVSDWRERGSEWVCEWFGERGSACSPPRHLLTWPLFLPVLSPLRFPFVLHRLFLSRMLSSFPCVSVITALALVGIAIEGLPIDRERERGREGERKNNATKDLRVLPTTTGASNR